MTFRSIRDELTRSARGRVAADRPLAPMTTYRVGGPAAVHFEPDDVADLEALSAALARAGGDVPVLAMGRGSNVVVSDKGFPGVVVRLGPSFSWLRAAEGDPRRVVAGAATSLPMVANWTARRSLAGMEFAIAIPGSIGGGVRMNAGAHGREVADCLEKASIFDLDTGAERAAPAADLGLSYRRSSLTERHVVVAADLRLEPDDEASIRARLEGYRRHRAETQPGAVQNAGSVFKNPEGDAAGRLVDAAGLKGFGVGGAAVSELHANFFIAGPGATAQDVYDLVHAVRSRVARHFGIELEPEIRFVGDFAAPSATVGGVA